MTLVFLLLFYIRGKLRVSIQLAAQAHNGKKPFKQRLINQLSVKNIFLLLCSKGDGFYVLVSLRMGLCERRSSKDSMCECMFVCVRE